MYCLRLVVLTLAPCSRQEVWISWSLVRSLGTQCDYWCNFECICLCAVLIFDWWHTFHAQPLLQGTVEWLIVFQAFRCHFGCFLTKEELRSPSSYPHTDHPSIPTLHTAKCLTLKHSEPEFLKCIDITKASYSHTGSPSDSPSYRSLSSVPRKLNLSTSSCHRKLFHPGLIETIRELQWQTECLTLPQGIHQSTDIYGARACHLLTGASVSPHTKERSPSHNIVYPILTDGTWVSHPQTPSWASCAHIYRPLKELNKSTCQKTFRSLTLTDNPDVSSLSRTCELKRHREPNV